jgi:outer membrane lipoprotein-sorting protein
MKRLMSVLFSLTVLATSGAMAAGLSAAQVAERNAAARGGLEAWRAVRVLTLTGQMDAGGTESARLPFTLTMARPNKNRLELKFQDQTAVQVYDGTQGWKLRPFLNRNEVEPYTAAEAASAAHAGELDGPLIDYARKGTKLESQGTDTVDGKQAYKLKLTLKDGRTQNVWVDEASFLEVKADGEPRRLDGKMHPVTVFYRDYKTVSGLVVPHTVETVVRGDPKAHKMTVETVVVNRPLDANAFAKPSAAAPTPKAK